MALPTPPLGARIADRRRALGLSQQAASTEAGLAISTWSMIERGDITNPSMDTCQRIARALNCQIGDIWGPAADEAVA